MHAFHVLDNSQDFLRFRSFALDYAASSSCFIAFNGRTGATELGTHQATTLAAYKDVEALRWPTAWSLLTTVLAESGESFWLFSCAFPHDLLDCRRDCCTSSRSSFRDFCLYASGRRGRLFRVWQSPFRTGFSLFCFVLLFSIFGSTPPRSNDFAALSRRALVVRLEKLWFRFPSSRNRTR